MMQLRFEPHSVRLPTWCSGKESACQGKIHTRFGFDPWVGKIPWRRKWQRTTAFLPEKFCGQRSLVGYSPKCHKELDMTEHTRTHKHNLTTEPGPLCRMLFHFNKLCVGSVTQSCPTLCNPMDYSLPGSSVDRIFQARMLEWVIISFSRGSFQPKDQTHVFCTACIGRWNLYHWAIWEAHHSTS